MTKRQTLNHTTITTTYFLPF